MCSRYWISRRKNPVFCKQPHTSRWICRWKKAVRCKGWKSASANVRIARMSSTSVVMLMCVSSSRCFCWKMTRASGRMRHRWHWRVLLPTVRREWCSCPVAVLGNPANNIICWRSANRWCRRVCRWYWAGHCQWVMWLLHRLPLRSTTNWRPGSTLPKRWRLRGNNCWKIVPPIGICCAVTWTARC